MRAELKAHFEGGARLRVTCFGDARRVSVEVGRDAAFAPLARQPSRVAASESADKPRRVERRGTVESEESGFGRPLPPRVHVERRFA